MARNCIYVIKIKFNTVFCIKSNIKVFETLISYSFPFKAHNLWRHGNTLYLLRYDMLSHGLIFTEDLLIAHGLLEKKFNSSEEQNNYFAMEFC